MNTLKVEVEGGAIEINQVFAKQFEIFKNYLTRLCNFDHFVKNPILKVFLDKKSDLKPVLTNILKQFQKVPPVLHSHSDEDKNDTDSKSKKEFHYRLFEYADMMKDYFPNITVLRQKKILDSPVEANDKTNTLKLMNEKKMTRLH